MINLNLQARLPTLAPAPPASSAAERSEDEPSFGISLSSRSSTSSEVDGVLKAKKERVLRLRKQIEQLQQKLRRANARLARIGSAKSGSDTGRAMLVSAARAQVLAISSALSMAQSALFLAETSLIGSVDTSA